MHPFHSQSAHATGVESLDHEHRRLIQTIDETCANLTRGADREPVLDALGLLYVRICAHFALEDRFARNASPELYTANKLKYEALLDRIRLMMDAFEDGQCEQCDRSLKDCLMSWMGEHLKAEHHHMGGMLAMQAAHDRP